MESLATIPADLTPAELDLKSVAELKAELAALVGLGARALLLAAQRWASLERKGVDLSDLRGGLFPYLPLIGCGAVLPELVVRFAGNLSLLHTLSAYPVEVQRRLADGEPIPVAVREAGRVTFAMLPAHALSSEQRRVALGEKGLRTEGEQRAIIEAQDSPKRPTVEDGTEIRIRLNRRELARLRADMPRGVSLSAYVKDLLRGLGKV
jgi:hypothetical protein